MSGALARQDGHERGPAPARHSVGGPTSEESAGAARSVEVAMQASAGRMDTIVHLFLTLRDGAGRRDLGRFDLGFVPGGGEEPVLDWEGRRIRARIDQIRIEFLDNAAEPIPQIHAREV